MTYVCSLCDHHAGYNSTKCPHCNLIFDEQKTNWNCPECNDIRSSLDRYCRCGYDRGPGKRTTSTTSTTNNYGGQSKYIALEFGEAVRICFKKYADINGRGSRSEYWWMVVFGMLLGVLLQIFDLIFFGEFGENTGPFSLLGILALTIPGFTMYVRRLHDTNRSGWNQLWALTIIGMIPLMIWICTEGDDGKNKYGKNPLNKRKSKKTPKSKEKNTEKIEKPTHAKTKVDKSTLAEKSKDKKELPKTDADEIAVELKKYKQMLSDGLINQVDYNAKKKKILGI